MQRTYIGDILRGRANGREVTVAGWAQDIRNLKNVTFIVLRDSTGRLQVNVKDQKLRDAVSDLARESVISVSGAIVEEPKSRLGAEIDAYSINILNRSDAPLPMGVDDPVEADFETRLNNRFIDLRKPEKAMIFRVESSMLWGIRKFLKEQGFVEVHSPKIVAAATEGGAELFPVQYFEKKAYLNQSPQLYKEILMSAGLDRVFEVGPAFRAEEHNTPRHLNEFTSVDIEVSFADHEDVMGILENAIGQGIKQVKEDLGGELEALSLRMPEARVPFPRITYERCLEELSRDGINVNFGEDLSPEQLRLLGDRMGGFYFITKWPSSLRPFYTMPDPERPEITNSFDLQFREKEITSGAQRVHDPKMLEQRFRAKGLNPTDFEFYIKAFRYGMPPHAGWGLGLERLVMILLDLPNIREATLFPRDRTRVVP